MVDSGDFGSSKSKSQILKVEYLLKGMSLLKYDAINLGERDLQYGIAFLSDMRDKYNLPFVSANVYDRSTGALFARPYTIKEVDGARIGIFGVTLALGVEKQVTPETGFVLKDPTDAAQGVVAELRDKTDVIIALAHLSINGATTLAQKVEGIDIIISGHNGSHVRSPYRVGNTVIMQPGSKGKYLGQLDFVYADGAISEIEGKTVALSESISDDPELAALVKEYDEAVLLAFPLESPRAQTRYSLLSEKACSGCHFRERRQWATTLHSHAWETLVEKKQAHNPECQQCHTTMFGELNGFASLKETPDMVGVQCAACHKLVAEDVKTHFERFRGNRATNGANNGKTRDFAVITQETCLKCHNEENSPHFDYEKFLTKVSH